MRWQHITETDWSRKTVQTDMDNATNGWETVARILAKQGFEQIGVGTRAKVYGNETYPFAIKIFRTEPCYESFVSFVLANPNKHFPRFRGKIVNVTANGNFRLIRVEKLTRAPYEGQSLFTHAGNALRVEALLKSIPALSDGEDDFMWAMTHGVQGIYTPEILNQKLAENEVEIKELTSKNPSFVQAMRLVFQNIVSDRCRCDYMPDNAMMRADGTLVINDPLAPN